MDWRGLLPFCLTARNPTRPERRGIPMVRTQFRPTSRGSSWRETRATIDRGTGTLVNSAPPLRSACHRGFRSMWLPDCARQSLCLEDRDALTRNRVRELSGNPVTLERARPQWVRTPVFSRAGSQRPVRARCARAPIRTGHPDECVELGGACAPTRAA